jgi:hypothetical protein
MNRRIAFAMTIWECKPWSWQIFGKQFRVATKIFDQQNSWAAATSTWTPTNEWQQNFSTEPKRRQGRPSKRWDDNLEKFAMNYFRISWGSCTESARMAILRTSVCTVLQQHVTHEPPQSL